MVLKYFTDGDFRFHSYILKEKVRQCKEKVQTLTESHDLHQSGVATFFIPFDTFLIKVWNITRNRFLCPLIYNPFSIIMRV